MQIREVIQLIEQDIPLSYAEDFDNVGLLTGNPEATLKGVLITHDAIEPVIDEAIAKDLNFIVSFHPILFKGIKSLTGKNYVEKALIKALKNDIAIYAIHTALDNQSFGVSGLLAKHLGLLNTRVLIPQSGTLRQLVTYVPIADAEKVRQNLFKAGAGTIGKYDQCSFNIQGTGTYRPLESAQPYLGEIGQRHVESEERISVIFPRHLQAEIVKHLLMSHPYEEVAYEVFTLENNHPEIGMGIIGELPVPVDEEAYLKTLKTTLNLSCIRHSALRGKPLKKVAVLGGSGSFGIDMAKAAGADIYITSDLKYHDFFRGESQMILADVGHYESEQYTKMFLFEQLTKKIRNFAVALSEINTNPINYF